ncbi:hypothetical protein GH714_036657 [Hevea brasiliensis]|uniref:Reverse transcriptase Ty1/copia-type domain-containing protein n=1 Tax=Hevea brasiliensis TaxID=3981 RepID=A0A6A6L987_HEVBR|nr:hypothetical protein GH714_036657 [Hevea brasiliensis]
MGPLHYFLGIQVLRQPTSLVLSQQKYLEDLLRETNMLTSKPCATPMPTAPTLSKAMGSPHPHPEHYRQVLGSLQYLTLTRPDIAFSVNKLAQFMHSPTDIHWQAVKRLLRYLRGTASLGLTFTKRTRAQEKRMTMTGMRILVDIFCARCGSILGWKNTCAYERPRSARKENSSLRGLRFWVLMEASIWVGLQAQAVRSGVNWLFSLD